MKTTKGVKTSKVVEGILCEDGNKGCSEGPTDCMLEYKRMGHRVFNRFCEVLTCCT